MRRRCSLSLRRMDVKTSNNCDLSLQEPSMLAAAICALWMIPCILGSGSSFWHLLWARATIEEHHHRYSDSLLLFFFRMLLYSFRGGEISRACLASCQPECPIGKPM